MALSQPCLAAAFAAAMDGLGPFEPFPSLAVAVSGGADSMALAVLARDWAQRRNGSTLALVVDHGLRATSAAEARVTLERLTCLGIKSQLLPLTALRHGSRLAERARIMRYDVLTGACREAGILHLLLGHHAADQVETLAMRVLRGSQTHGLAGMSALLETQGVRLLRPLLTIDPALLRQFLTASGVAWIEDPSNQDVRALRPRLRQRMKATAATELQLALAAVGELRAREEAETAAELARCATIRPEGFALLSSGRISAAALGRLIQTIGGAPYKPHPDQINGLVAQLKPATVAGVRIMPAGRYGDGFLIVRENAAVMAPVEARPDMLWDNRFRVFTPAAWQAGAMIGKLGSDAVRFRGASDLPSAVLQTLPAVRVGNFLAAVPHLDYVSDLHEARVTVLFTPPKPIGGPCFVPATQNLAGRFDLPVVIRAGLVDDHRQVGM